MTRTVFLLIAGIAAGIAATLIWLLEQPVSSVAPAPASQAAAPSAAAPAEPARKPREIQLAPAPNLLGVGLDYKVEPPFVILDGLTFAAESGRPTRLAGVTGPVSEAVCLDGDGKLWACGLQARAALNNIIRRQTIECRTVAAAQGTVFQAACTVGGADLATQLVRAGFARPDSGAPPDRAAAEAEARSQARGLWVGGWQIRS